ncbi:MAG: hypothetical protein QM783_08260 [Phycisphaerales bacterium]
MARKTTQPAYRHPRDTRPAPGEAELIAVAKRVTQATGAPVIGGVAVILHGGGRTTADVDILSEDLWTTHIQLEDAGILWDSKRREHVTDGIPVRLVPIEMVGSAEEGLRKASTIKGVKVVSLADLVRIKLASGLANAARAKDLAHVVDLVQRVPLDKSFASKLPQHLRAPFKKLVDTIRQD